MNRTGDIKKPNLDIPPELSFELQQTVTHVFHLTAMISRKYEAELLVRGIMDKVPTTVIRPGVVKGNSKTGETIKFDRPYFTLNLFNTLKFLPIIPYMGSGKAEGNFVPVEYIFDATLFLSHVDVMSHIPKF